MNYILRNYEFNTDNKKAFEIYSDYTCEHLEYVCNYNAMIKVMHDNIDMMLDDGLIDYQEAWLMKDDYLAYNELVESLENVNC